MKKKEIITTIGVAIILLGMSYMFSNFKEWNKHENENEETMKIINESIRMIRFYKKEIPEIEKNIDLNESESTMLQVGLNFYRQAVDKECLTLKSFDKEFDIEIEKYCQGR